jgi:hypothetical protein
LFGDERKFFKKREREKRGQWLFSQGQRLDMPCWLCWLGFLWLLGAIRG